PRQTEAKAEEDSAAVILREISALFPNQIRAIIKDESGLKFILAEEANIQPAQPLVLKVCVSDGCQEIITFSGQSIEIAGRRVTLRAETGDRIVINGESFLWSSDLKDNSVPNLRIESRRL